MFSVLIRFARSASRRAVRAAEVLAGRIAVAWRSHLERVNCKPGYAAATAAVLAGALGLITAHEVVAAVLAGLLGVYLRGTQEAGGAMGATASSIDLY
jgi:hypothetical protein